MKFFNFDVTVKSDHIDMLSKLLMEPQVLRTIVIPNAKAGRCSRSARSLKPGERRCGVGLCCFSQARVHVLERVGPHGSPQLLCGTASAPQLLGVW